MIKQFFRDVREWGWGVAWHNLRFSLGYAIGGFDWAHKP